ncbi:MAG TPA: hypothetical protein VHC49_12790 [Mycobacteriales bacterium]|nr:hypothetical protein [Mycobacteriales bacterium]
MPAPPDDDATRPRPPGRHAAGSGRRRRRGAHAADQRLREAVALQDDDLHIFGRSAKFWGAWIAGLLFVISAALGGLKSAAAPAPAKVRPGTSIDAGEFDITLTQAVVQEHPAGSFQPAQLRLLATITLTAKRATTDARPDIISLSGFHGLKSKPYTTYDPRDDSLVTLIPGHAVPVAYSWDLPKKPTIPDSVTVRVSDLAYIHSSSLSGYEEWLVNHPVASVRLPVAVTKVAQ